MNYTVKCYELYILGGDKMRLRLSALAMIILLTTPLLGSDWMFEGFLGGAWNVSTYLTIVQKGYTDISLKAEYEERTFEGFPYYDLRLSRWSNDRAWELELVHHKIYLANPSAEIQRFSISDGFNIIAINRAWDVKKIIWRLGAGVVLTHPESTIRGSAFDEHKGLFAAGLYFSGVALQAAVGKQAKLWRGLFLSFEGKVTVSFVQVPIHSGHADLSNVAFHILAGLGYRI